jgi:ABC-type bacteriocin/lantibiotic exporter with double-glycine peptidase domain
MLVSTFLINTCVQAALLYIGTKLIEENKLTPEVLLAFMLYQGQLQVSYVASSQILSFGDLVS